MFNKTFFHQIQILGMAVLLLALAACQAASVAPTSAPSAAATTAPTATAAKATAIAPTAVPTTAPAQAQTTSSPKNFKIPMSFAMDAKWHITDDYSDVVTLESDDYSVDLAFILVKDVQVADPKDSFSKVAFPDDFVTWIQEHSLFPIVKTNPIVVAGFQGTEIHGVVTADCGTKRNWLFLSWTGWNCRKGEYYRFISLGDVYGERVLIMNTGGPSSEQDFNLGVAASQKVVDSVVFSKPSAAQAPTNADAIAGIWSGTVNTKDFTFQITTTIAKSCAIGSVCGPFDIPAIPCSGAWTLMGISGTTYQFQASNFKGKCTGGGAADSLQLLPDGTLLYTCTGSCGDEKGVLQRKVAQAPNPQLVEYNIPTVASEPGGIVAGSDGALWAAVPPQRIWSTGHVPCDATNSFLVRIDPQTNQVVGKLGVPCAFEIVPDTNA